MQRWNRTMRTEFGLCCVGATRWIWGICPLISTQAGGQAIHNCIFSLSSVSVNAKMVSAVTTTNRQTVVSMWTNAVAITSAIQMPSVQMNPVATIVAVVPVSMAMATHAHPSQSPPKRMTHRHGVLTSWLDRPHRTSHRWHPSAGCATNVQSTRIAFKAFVHVGMDMWAMVYDVHVCAQKAIIQPMTSVFRSPMKTMKKNVWTNGMKLFAEPVIYTFYVFCCFPVEVQPFCHKDGCSCPTGYQFHEDNGRRICNLVQETKNVPTDQRKWQRHLVLAQQFLTFFINFIPKFIFLFPVPCDVLHNCHPNANCEWVEAELRNRCVCNPGYEGNGIECIVHEVSCLDVSFTWFSSSLSYRKMYFVCLDVRCLFDTFRHHLPTPTPSHIHLLREKNINLNK